jgi:hypothetical protein
MMRSIHLPVSQRWVGSEGVQTTQAWAVGAVPRRLLLFTVLAGLVLMHTLGHTVHEGHIPAPPSSSSSGTISAGLADAHPAHAEQIPIPALTPEPAPGPAMTDDGAGTNALDPLALCLAVLIAAAALLLAVRSSRPAEVSGVRDGGRRSRRRVNPRPCRHALAGLCLARSAVLRT